MRQLTDPLTGAAPTIQPTARPLAIQPGATPPPRRSPLGELAEAFQGFNEPLRQGLAQAAAQADNAAYTQGQLEATKQGAAQRMGELDTLIKQGVDNGDLPTGRAPAFIRGFNFRTGTELGDAFQGALTAQLQDVTRADTGGPQAIQKAVTDTYNKYASQLHPDNIDGMDGFDRSAQVAIARFNEQASAGYMSAYTAAGKQKMADETSETAFQLATAGTDIAPGVRTLFKTQVDQIRKELPVSEVNGFLAQNVVQPAIVKLIAQDKIPEAQALLTEMDGYDLTGQGGLLGKTEAAKTVFSELQLQLDRESKAHNAEAFQKLADADKVTALNATHDAGNVLLQLRNNNNGRLPSADAQDQILNDYRAKHPTDSVANDAFAEAVHSEFANEERWRANSKDVSDLALAAHTLDPDKIAATQGLLDNAYHTGAVPASVRTQIQLELDKNRAMAGAIDEQDFKNAAVDLYGHLDQRGQAVPNFGDLNDDSPTASTTLWNGDTFKKVAPLPDNLKEQHEVQTKQFFETTLRASLLNLTGGNPDLVPSKKQAAIDDATNKSRAFAKSLLQQMTQQAATDKAALAVTQHAKQIRDARYTGSFLAAPTFNYNQKLTDSAGNPVERGATYKLPSTDKSFMQWAPTQAREGLPEADKVEVYFPAKTLSTWLQPGNPEGKSNIVDLPALAKDIIENPKPEASAQAKNVYAYVKGLIGFTPEEVLSGVTKHGIPFDSSQIDPTRISVFRNRGELEKAWNNGEPTDQFLKVGDAVDPKDRMTPQALYLAQLALLTHKL